MKYCVNCGNQLNDADSFCNKCGTAVSEASGPSREATQEFEGGVKICPGCKKQIPAFAIKCPDCGLEFRNVKSSNGITEFTTKLNSMSAQQKAGFISSFPIPNTKEDFMEFLWIVSSEYVQQNYVSMGSVDYFIYKAWESKYKQLKAKASILFKNDKEMMEQVNQIFNSTKKKMHPAIKIIIILVPVIIALFLLLLALD